MKFNLILGIFFVILFSNFISAVDVTDCGYLNSANTVYNLKNNVNSTTTCFTVNATNVTLDLNGFEVVYGNQNSSTAYYGIYANNQDYAIVKNGSVRRGDNAVISQTRDGIYFYSVANGTIENINASINNYGIYLYTSDYNIINNITANYNYNHGIYLYYGSDNNNVSNVVANYNYNGIYLYYGLILKVNYNILENLTLNSNEHDGMIITGGNYNTLRNIIANSNADFGIYFSYLNDNPIVTNVTANYNGDSGVQLGSTDNCIVTNIITNYNTRYGFGVISVTNGTFVNLTANSNNLSGLTFQVYIINNTIINFTANNNTVRGVYLTNNNIHDNSFTNGITNFNAQSGIYLNYSWNNNFTNITASSNLMNGFHFWNSSTGNIIKNSRIENNAYGLYFEHFGSGIPQSNKFYNNVINNSINYYNTTSMTNYFNTTLTTATNILGRPYQGGNFWGFPNGTGFSDTCTDADKNGICDLSYNIDGVSKDSLPLYVADTVGPAISFPLYTNGTLKNISEILTLNISVTDVLSNVSSCLFNINGTNQSVAYSNGWCNLSSISLAGMSGGNNTIRIYANDSLNNFGLNNSYVVLVDADAPLVTINSPTNRTYSTDSITFNVGAEDDSGIISSCRYSLDGNSNISLTYFGGYWTGTNSSMLEGKHNVTFYCNDSMNKKDSSVEYFTITFPEEGESSSTTSGASTEGTTTAQEKSVTVYLNQVTASKEVTSVVALQGIYLTRITTLSNENITHATIAIKTINSIVDAGLLGGLDETNVYQGLQINATGLNKENIENITFEFKIEKSWLAGKNTSQITFQRKPEGSTEWMMLNTTLISDDNNYYYFNAVSPGFSLFAIYFDENLCVPGELFCSNEILKLCGANRDSTIIENCEFGCSFGKCLEYWEPDEEESIWQRVTKLIFGTWLTFGTLVFSIIVAIVSLSLILVSFITYNIFRRRGLIKK